MENVKILKNQEEGTSLSYSSSKKDANTAKCVKEIKDRTDYVTSYRTRV